ncbi:hypothetical protein [Deefgea salmonis]|uniref:4-deoxy-4-formamido-L-arabinose-phosphoundecaprenol deformylase ArnD n=1 Tax=Deefgea salmonis TaxID=2875502 RepID=A0ABS8BK60_9NEIS|nr:hypothetical protein [Deefgea salmonis]MCB5195961.1 hypothetical protein [Deefgea salmonis]
MKLIALKIDVDNLSAMERGLPRLQQILTEHACGATFFWSLGIEKNGRFLLPGSRLRRVSGSSLLTLKKRFGVKALCRGALWPAPTLMTTAMLARQDLDSFEHALRPARNDAWQNDISSYSATMTAECLKRAYVAFTQNMKGEPVAFSAKGWQGNKAVYRLEQMMGWRFASDTRGSHPFWPVVNAETSRCVQLPVTLPMLEELPSHGRVESILAQTQKESPWGHVYNAAADFDGIQAADDFIRLLKGWIEQGYQVVALGELYQQLDRALIPYHEVVYQSCTGRYGLLATQGVRYPK